MKCSNCQSENSDTAKFCKKCGTPLDQSSINHEEMIKSMSGEKSGDNNTTKIIIIALAIVAIVLAGAFIYLFASGDSNASDSASNSAPASQDVKKVNESTEKVATKTSSSAPSTASSDISIKGGSFSTGSADADKTYASIYVGKENAGKDVIVQIWYSRDGNTLNNGNMVPATVHSDGYLEIASADAYKYYPDYATINIYDSGSHLLDSQSVSLSPTSGTQTF